MLSEIGSNFWLNPHQEYAHTDLGTPQQFNCQGEDFAWLSTGRSAIKFAIQTIERICPQTRKVAVLPSFTCDTVFEPFLKLGYDIYYYLVERNLTTTSEAIMETVKKHNASIVLIHRYFGFDTLDNKVDKMCEFLREQGIFTIEDCTQSLYSCISRAKSDFIVGSIRKWTGTPDGGFAVIRKGKFINKPIEPDVTLEREKIKASYAKYRYLFEHSGNKRDMLAMYRNAEKILDKQNSIYSISRMSTIVQANLDRDELIRKRRENFTYLSDNLKGIVEAVFTLEQENVPLYFPILVEDRTSYQKHLVQNAIYAPVVWPKDDKQPKQCDGAENAYEHLLCIPIDQRYSLDDMERIVSEIRKINK